MPGTGRHDAGGIYQAVFGGWCVARGTWQVAGGQNLDIGQYHSLNRISCAATEMRSHDASWS